MASNYILQRFSYFFKFCKLQVLVHFLVYLSESGDHEFLAHISLNDADDGPNGKVDVNITTTSDCDTFLGTDM